MGAFKISIHGGRFKNGVVVVVYERERRENIRREREKE
jgi:hypothetical protein